MNTLNTLNTRNWWSDISPHRRLDSTERSAFGGHFEQAPVGDLEASRKTEANLWIGRGIASVAAKVGLVVLISGTPAQAEVPLTLTPQQRSMITQVDSDAEIIDDVVIVASSAEAACALVNLGEGLYISDATTDPRILLLGRPSGPESVGADIMPDMPAGFDPCIWTALVDLAPNAQDVRAIKQFESVGDGTGTLPPPPTFFSDPTVLGLEAGATPPMIFQRWGALTTLLNQAEAAAGTEFYAPVSVLAAEESRIGAEAARLDADEAVRDAEVARARAEAARALADALERAVTN